MYVFQTHHCMGWTLFDFSAVLMWQCMCFNTSLHRSKRLSHFPQIWCHNACVSNASLNRLNAFCVFCSFGVTMHCVSVQPTFAFFSVYRYTCVWYAAFHWLKRISSFPRFGVGYTHFALSAVLPSECIFFIRVTSSVKTIFAFSAVFGTTRHVFETRNCIGENAFCVVLGMVCQCTCFKRVTASVKTLFCAFHRSSVTMNVFQTRHCIG